MSKTRNQHKKLVQFMKQAGVTNSLISNQSVFPLINDYSSTHDQKQSKLQKSKRGRKKKNQQAQTNLIQTLSKKNKIELKASQKVQERNNIIITENQEAADKSQNLPIILELGQKYIEPTTNYSQVSNLTYNFEIQKEDVQCRKLSQKYFYPDCVNKSGNTFYGYFGHTTILTDIPIIQGNYFIEVKILPHSINNKNIEWCKIFRPNLDIEKNQFKSAVRIGIAHQNYNLLTPLGGVQSYALKSIDGSIIYNRQIIQKSQNIQFDNHDIIGVLLHSQPPLPIDKNQKVQSKPKAKFNQNNKLEFYKNGIKIKEIKNLEHLFYVFGISLFNWANVEINKGPVFEYPPIKEDIKPYSQIYSEHIPYKDLKFL